MKNDTGLKVCPFEKGSGFVIIKQEDGIKKIEEQIGKLNVIDYD